MNLLNKLQLFLMERFRNGRSYKLIQFSTISCFVFVSSFLLIITGVSCASDLSKEDEIFDPNQTVGVTYNGNGHTAGSVPIDAMMYSSIDEIEVLMNTSLIKEGYIFNGWNTMADGSGQQYDENTSFTATSLDLVFYAQWLSEIAYNEFIASNVSIIDFLNVAPLEVGNWYHASVDVFNGSLTLNDGSSNSKLQFQYNSIGIDNKGYLRIKYNPNFRTVSNDGLAVNLSSGSVISSNIFKGDSHAEISGVDHNWGDKNNTYIPILISKENQTHYGYIKVSFNDAAGQLAIHATAYNRLPEKEIFAGQVGQ